MNQTYIWLILYIIFGLLFISHSFRTQMASQLASENHCWAFRLQHSNTLCASVTEVKVNHLLCTRWLRRPPARCHYLVWWGARRQWGATPQPHCTCPMQGDDGERWAGVSVDSRFKCVAPRVFHMTHCQRWSHDEWWSRSLMASGPISVSTLIMDSDDIIGGRH